MFRIDPKIFENNNGLLVGVVVLKGVNNKDKNLDIKNLLREAESQLRNDFDSEKINQHPQILAWREAHKKFGNDPRRYAPSVWAIAKRVVKGGELPAINNLVDLYNYICLRYVVPVGGEDLDKCSGDIVLTYADGDENFREIGAIENNPPEKGEIVYKDNDGVLCRKFNWREADRTKLTEETKNAVIVIEALSPIERGVLEKAIIEFRDLVQKYCGGTAQFFILDENNINAKITL